jgi:uncharacterized protein
VAAFFGEGLLEGGAVVVLVPDQGLAGPGGEQIGAGGEHVQQHVAFVGFGAGQGERNRQPMQGGDQVQPQAPKVAGMAGAVPVLCPAGQVRALDRLPRPAALDRGGIHDPHVIAPDAGVGGQDTDAIPDQRRGRPQPFVVTGLAGQVRKQVPQVCPRVPQPPRLGGEPQQGLQHRQGDQLGITQLRVDAHARPPRRELRRFLQQVIGLDIQCGGEGVQVCRHKPILDALASSPQLCLGIGRLVWTMPVAVISLIVGFFVGGGWYLAEKIRSEALEVEPAAAMPPYDDVQVVGLSPGQVQLRVIGDQPALVKPQLYGIAWQGGVGRLAASAKVSGDVITRPLTVTAGSAPTVGQLAALDRSYFLGDPRKALDIPLQDVIVQGPLGPLPAWYFPGLGSTFVIGVHGQNGTRKDVLRVIDIAHHMGFPALAVTYRNDLGVARDPSGYFRYGQTEWRDLEAAVRWSLSHGAQRVVLAGQSMGGAVIAAFLEHSLSAPKVARVVFDAPMLDLHAAVEHQASRRSLPVIGSIPSLLVWPAERIASARFGVDWSSTRYLDEAMWLKIPALVTHGDDDIRVPISISIRLKELKPSLVKFARFADAGHLESWNIDRARYTSLMASFLAPVAP